MVGDVDRGQHALVPPRGKPHQALVKLGARIRQLRLAKGWSQEDLAGEAVLDRSYISGLESGMRNPTYLNLLKIAGALDLSVQRLLDV
jgi:transcriptional regulator with XRE-family HTH domain